MYPKEFTILKTRILKSSGYCFFPSGCGGFGEAIVVLGVTVEMHVRGITGPCRNHICPFTSLSCKLLHKISISLSFCTGGIAHKDLKPHILEVLLQPHHC